MYEKKLISNKFSFGDFVVYQRKDVDGNIYVIEFGIVKKMHPNNEAVFVWYHAGCNAESTPIKYLERCTYEMSQHYNVHRGCSHCMPDKEVWNTL